MNQLQNKIKLETLILILKNWDNLRREYQVVEAYLESLPRDLIALNIYQSKLHLLDGYNEKVLEKDLNGIKQRLDFYLPHLVKINKSLKNAIALRERIEIIEADSFVSINTSELASNLAPSLQVHHKPTFTQRISRFKTQSPENFWSIIIATLLLLVLVWQGKPMAVNTLHLFHNTTEIDG